MVDTNMPSHPDKTWMPIAGGILSIVAGVLAFIVVLFLLWGIIATWAPGDAQIETGIVLASWWLVTGILATIGGIFSLRRSNWSLALIGSIASVFTIAFILGILSIVFVTISRKEFTS